MNTEMGALLTVGRGPARPTSETLQENLSVLARGERPAVITGLWALPRPLTSSWGSGEVFRRVSLTFGEPDAAFGVRDGIPPRVLGVDIACHAPRAVAGRGSRWAACAAARGSARAPRVRAAWAALPFLHECFGLGYWDPPYVEAAGSMMKREAQEIWRVCRQLAILSEHVYPRSWFAGAHRIAQIGVTMGPMRRIRTLQVFGRDYLSPRQASLAAFGADAQ